MHWSEVGAGNAPDVEIMTFARAHGYMVFAHDLDFGADSCRHAGREAERGVAVPNPSIRPREAIGDALVAALRQMAGDLDEGALVTVEPDRMRVRLLPLRPR